MALCGCTNKVFGPVIKRPQSVQPKKQKLSDSVNTQRLYNFLFSHLLMNHYLLLHFVSPDYMFLKTQQVCIQVVCDSYMINYEIETSLK